VGLLLLYVVGDTTFDKDSSVIKQLLVFSFFIGFIFSFSGSYYFLKYLRDPNQLNENNLWHAFIMTLIAGCALKIGNYSYTSFFNFFVNFGINFGMLKWIEIKNQNIMKDLKLEIDQDK